jgi:hypothetical protein
VAASDRRVDGQDRGQRFHHDPDGELGQPERLAGLGPDQDDRLADVMALLAGQNLLVLEDRTKLARAGDVDDGQDRDHAIDLHRLGDVNRNDPAPGDRTADEVDE